MKQASKQHSQSKFKPEPGRGDDITATSPSLKVHLHSCTGRTMTSYHPEVKNVNLD